MAWDNEKKKVKTAVAVAYEPGDKAPKILASGRGEVAEKIIAKAKENDVPFYKDNKLAETLSKLEIGDAIPPELYEVVAEILVFVDDMDGWMNVKVRVRAWESGRELVYSVYIQTFTVFWSCFNSGGLFGNRYLNW